MKKHSLYSKSARPRRVDTPAEEDSPRSAQAPPGPASTAAPEVQPALPPIVHRPSRLRAFMAKHERFILVLSSVLISVLLVLGFQRTTPPDRKLTQRDIDAAVLHTLEQKTNLPSPEAKAYQRIRPSVVRVSQLGTDKNDSKGKTLGVGTGVVVVDKGLILTNLHVVAGADKIQVDFADGTESEAVVILQQPENDLAVLQATTVPDDLIPATLRSTVGLKIGDKVVAVGFPFNIGPSASSGIVSGLKRNYHSQDEQRVLANLIQFDAAANPGNSGGPLITMDGEVVGIVTAILSPNPQGSFIGIGFAVPIETAAAAAGEAPF